MSTPFAKLIATHICCAGPGEAGGGRRARRPAAGTGRGGRGDRGGRRPWRRRRPRRPAAGGNQRPRRPRRPRHARARALTGAMHATSIVATIVHPSFVRRYNNRHIDRHINRLMLPQLSAICNRVRTLRSTRYQWPTILKRVKRRTSPELMYTPSIDEPTAATMVARWVCDGCNDECAMRCTNQGKPDVGGSAEPPLTRNVHPGPHPIRQGPESDRGDCHY